MTEITDKYPYYWQYRSSFTHLSLPVSAILPVVRTGKHRTANLLELTYERPTCGCSMTTLMLLGLIVSLYYHVVSVSHITLSLCRSLYLCFSVLSQLYIPHHSIASSSILRTEMLQKRSSKKGD